MKIIKRIFTIIKTASKNFMLSLKDFKKSLMITKLKDNLCFKRTSD